MDLKAFEDTLSANTPPEDFTEIQKGLWHAANGDWDAAHNVAQDHEGVYAFDHLHAYLHRVEGDNGNAAYWYRRAGEPVCTKSLKEELQDLLRKYL